MNQYNYHWDKPVLVSLSNGQGVQSEDMLHSLLLVLDWLTGVTPLTGRLQSGIHGDQWPKGKSAMKNFALIEFNIAYYTHLQYIQYTPTVHSIHTYSTFNTHLQYIQYTPTVHSIHTHMYVDRSRAALYIAYTCTVYSRCKRACLQQHMHCTMTHIRYSGTCGHTTNL